MKKSKIAILIIFSLCINRVNAQIDTTFLTYKLDFKRYLGLVSSNNLEYAAQKYSVPISDAAIEVAKVFPNPNVEMDWTENREGSIRAGYAYSFGIDKTFELGGKRKARIDLARSNSSLTKALLADYFRKLQADASLVYLEALKQNSLFKVRVDSWQAMKQLAEADSVRLKLGSIMEIDAVQSKVEDGILLNGVLEAEADWKNAFSQITLMTGVPKSDTLYYPNGNLQIPNRSFLLNDLITTAQNNRADLVAALCNKEVSRMALVLAHKERKLDIDLKLGAGNLYSLNQEFPNTTAITGGIAIPLKFSNHYKGEIKMAQFQILQAEDLYKQAELQIRVEISQAFQRYNAFCKQVDRFDNGLLENAQKVRQGKIYSYNRGETSLLEVLNAQRVFNDTQIDYFETLYNRAAALVELEKAAGIWDINF
jgi:outer membrane protein, heavy metal efflux system